MANKTNIWNINHNVIKKCIICGKEYKVKWSHIKRRKTCSKECRHKLQKIVMQGKNNPKWKGGVFQRDDGYKLIRIGNKYVYEHILVWQQNNGKIPEGFVIHHINEDKADNRIDNLACMSNSQHMKLHNNFNKM